MSSSPNLISGPFHDGLVLVFAVSAALGVIAAIVSALGHRGRTGPMPVRSHGPHAYAFQLFALDQAPGLPASFTLDDVIAAIKGHAIGRARLDGTYEIR